MTRNNPIEDLITRFHEELDYQITVVDGGYHVVGEGIDEVWTEQDLRDQYHFIFEE